MSLIETDIIINAPPSTVRSIILDFDSYPQWNPFLTSIKTSTTPVTKGTKLDCVANGTPFSPIVQENSPDKFGWTGALLGQWFFCGHHSFEFQPFGELGASGDTELGANGETESCKLVQMEKFGGIAAYLILLLIGQQTKKGFNDMNKAVKERAEALTGGTAASNT